MERYKILLVDDEQGIVTMLKDYFEFMDIWYIQL